MRKQKMYFAPKVIPYRITLLSCVDRQFVGTRLWKTEAECDYGFAGGDFVHSKSR